MVRTALALALMLTAAPAFAKTSPAPAVAASVPDQPWYPPGYRDLRIAAAGTVALFPRRLADDRGGYDVVDCMSGYDLPQTTEWQLHQRENLALDVARMRSELARLGYTSAVYDGPLLAYERASLAHFPSVPAPDWYGHPYNAAQEAADEADEAKAEAATSEAPAQAAAADAAAAANAAADAAAANEDSAYDSFWGLDKLAKAMDARRKRLQPHQPRIIEDGGCGGGEQEFTVTLAPATGHLWLVNAFAFKLCERKRPDPWDHRACGWTEYLSGDKTIASGRYMYEARWPGGGVRRGAKILDENEDGGAIVIRRD